MVAGSLSAAGSLRDLFLVGIGGAAFGLVVAFLVRQVRRHLDDPLVEIAVTLLTPYLAYVPAEQLGLSGILAGVASGVYLGWWHSEITSPGTRLQADAFWEVFIFLLESILFVLIGLQVPTVLDALGDRSSLELARWAVLVSLAVIGIRVVWVFVVTYLPPLLSPRLRVVKNPDWRNVAVISWAGMRGAVSLAAALAIPLTIESGAPFPNRDLVLFLTLAVIGATLVVQGLTLPVLIKLLGVEEIETDERKAAVARFRTTEAALGRIAELSFEDDEAGQNALDRAREMYTARARQLTGICRTGIPDTEDSELAWLQLRRELLDVERAALRDLQREGRVNIGVLRQVERDLDLEEAPAHPAGGAAAGGAGPGVSDPVLDPPVDPARDHVRGDPRGAGDPRPVRGLRVPLHRGGGAHRARAAAPPPAAGALRVPPPAPRRAPPGDPGRRGGRGRGRAGRVLAHARPAAPAPAGAERRRPAGLRRRAGPRRAPLRGRARRRARTGPGCSRTARARCAAAPGGRRPSSSAPAVTRGSTTWRA